MQCVELLDCSGTEKARGRQGLSAGGDFAALQYGDFFGRVKRGESRLSLG